MSLNVIFVGPINSGKTTRLYQLVKKAKKENKKIGGILNLPVMQKGEKIGYDVVDLLTDKKVPFARLNSITKRQEKTDLYLGRWVIFYKGIQFANEALLKAYVCQADLIIVDEVGHLELQGKGLKPMLDKIMDSKLKKILVVRSSLENQVKSLYKNYKFDKINIHSKNSKKQLELIFGN